MLDKFFVYSFKLLFSVSETYDLCFQPFVHLTSIISYFTIPVDPFGLLDFLHSVEGELKRQKMYQYNVTQVVDI